MDVVLWLVLAIVIVWAGFKIVGGLASLAVSLIVGGIAGWLAGLFMRGRGFGVLKNILIGVVGAVVGGILFSLLGLRWAGLIGSIATATFGAVVVLYLARWVQK